MIELREIYEKEGSDYWFTDDPKRFLGKDYKVEDFEKLTDIEVWFDSGSSHSFVLEKREDLKWPADMYLEGSISTEAGFIHLYSSHVEREEKLHMKVFFHTGL